MDISKDARDLIDKMIMLKPCDRLSIPEILNHPWVRDPEEDDDSDNESDLISGVSMDRNEVGGAKKGADKT